MYAYFRKLPTAVAVVVAVGAACMPNLENDCRSDDDCPVDLPTCIAGVCLHSRPPDIVRPDAAQDPPDGDEVTISDAVVAPVPDTETGEWDVAADGSVVLDTGPSDGPLDVVVIVDIRATADRRAPDAALDAIPSPHDATPDRVWDGPPSADSARPDASLCEHIEVSEEICDGVDNDCDGEIDETFPDLASPCSVGVGDCFAPGNQLWAADGLSTICDAVPGPPRAETCDNQDNDCDGRVDEDLVQPCYFGPPGTADVGECRSGTFTCAMGDPTPCANQVHPSDELCDGLDNDCDGRVDEDLPGVACYEGDPADLEPPSTVCRAGARHCADGAPGRCEGQVLPTQGEDGCNDLDDDCDGNIDEDCRCRAGAPCEGGGIGRCARGLQICDGNELVGCEGRVEPTDEICNRLDDDCNGAIDDHADVPCYSGPESTEGQGVCRSGLRICDLERGELADLCSDEVTPTDERCDGLDNDCDGEIDEDFDALGAPCTGGRGECRTAGLWTCHPDGGRRRCTAQPGEPTPERCDGLDNDCDGEIDEETDAACYTGPEDTEGVGPCRAGVRRCVDGAPEALCSGDLTPAPETCDLERIDDDCDGEANEGCACLDGEVGPYDAGVGACRGGTQTCRDGEWGACDNAVGPSDEICNGVDDDCDGTVDDGVSGFDPRCPAPSCLLILASHPDAESGEYFVDRNGEPRPTLCDMTTEGGGWTLIFEDDFEDAPDPRWSLSETYPCGEWSTILGGYGIIAGGEISIRLSTQGVPHTELRANLDYIKIDSWDGEEGYVEIDGQSIWREAQQANGQEMCGWNRGFYISFDDRHAISAILPHRTPEIRLVAGSTLNQIPTDESFGIDNIRVWAR